MGAHRVEGGWTCLHWAVHTAGSAQTAQAVSATRGADHRDEVDDVTDLLGSGESCGCCAPEPARPGSRGLLQRILTDLERQSGCVDSPSDDGATALMFAADAGDREVCEWLLAAGADLAAKDSDGDTAAVWARSQGHQKLSAWLQQPSQRT